MVPGARSFPARRRSPWVAPALECHEVPPPSRRRKRRKRHDGGGRQDADPAGRRPALPYPPPMQTAKTVDRPPPRAGTVALWNHSPMQTAKTVDRRPLRRGEPLPYRPPADANGDNGGPASAAGGDRRAAAPGTDANGENGRPPSAAGGTTARPVLTADTNGPDLSPHLSSDRVNFTSPSCRYRKGRRIDTTGTLRPKRRFTRRSCPSPCGKMHGDEARPVFGQNRHLG
jgi:hypothetical protein